MKAIAFTELLALMLGALQLLPAALAQQEVTDFVYGLCNTAISESDTAFAANLDAVARSLNQTSSLLMYSLASSDLTSAEGTFVYGMYQCRGDISLSDCGSCVRNGLRSWNQICTGNTNISGGMRLQFKGCYLRYERYVFSDTLEIEYAMQPSCSGSSMDSSELYQQNLGRALEDSANAAAGYGNYSSSSVGSGSNTAYALTQCLGYLNTSQCATCLSQVSNYSNACNGSVSGEVYFGTCYYLFNNTPLVFTYNTPPSPDAAPSQAPAIILASPLSDQTSKNHTAIIVGVVVGVCVLLTILIMTAYFLKRPNKSVKPGAKSEICKTEDPLLHPGEHELLTKGGARRFSLRELQDATDNFHPNNKLGEGGFGPVYQGRLKSGIEVAIKMLSAQSHQGKAEFLNEVNLITTVRHRNLIQLIGCCVEDNKPLLVYEYLPNRSLNLHLFDVNENDGLDWPTRFEIILGIARGLRYLHEDSHVRIIHRDIKASNILLDNKMNPKIADFGMARLFSDDRNHLTTRVVGTLGYLAPEYAISGQLTEKADVYSFGLVALEIVSGRKVIETTLKADKQNLLDWTWALYEKQQQLQIVDERMQNTRERLDTNVSMQVNVEEVTRVVHVALLCTQLQSQVRPSMSEVHNMLCGQLEILKLPTKPITVGMSNPLIHDDNSSILVSSTMPSRTSNSYDTATISEIGPR